MAYNPEQIAEEFFEAVRRVHALGAGTPETAYYPALNTLFERVGASLRPKVLPVSQLANTGAGSPDFGLFAARQIQKGAPRPGQAPERGVVEVKGEPRRVCRRPLDVSHAAISMMSAAA